MHESTEQQIPDRSVGAHPNHRQKWSARCRLIINLYRAKLWLLIDMAYSLPQGRKIQRIRVTPSLYRPSIISIAADCMYAHCLVYGAATRQLNPITTTIKHKT